MPAQPLWENCTLCTACPKTARRPDHSLGTTAAMDEAGASSFGTVRYAGGASEGRLTSQDLRRMGLVIAPWLQRACGVEKASTSLFDSAYPPSLSVGLYFERVALLLELSESQIALATEYLGRYLRATDGVTAESSLHRLLATALVLAHKFDDDFARGDASYGHATGLRTSELMLLQMAFLRKVDYRLMYPRRFWCGEETGEQPPE